MPLFKKGNKKEESADQAEQLGGEDEGLFMSTTSGDEGAGERSEDAPIADGDLVGSAGAASGGAPAADAPAGDASAAAGGEEAPTEGGSVEASASGDEPAGPDPAFTVSGGDDVDPLSAFRDVTGESPISGLTKDLEDIPMAELLQEAREVRALLPATPPEDEEVEAASE